MDMALTFLYWLTNVTKYGPTNKDFSVEYVVSSSLKISIHFGSMASSIQIVIIFVITICDQIVIISYLFSISNEVNTSILVKISILIDKRQYIIFHKTSQSDVIFWYNSIQSSLSFSLFLLYKVVKLVLVQRLSGWEYL